MELEQCNLGGEKKITEVEQKWACLERQLIYFQIAVICCWYKFRPSYEK